MWFFNADVPAARARIMDQAGDVQWFVLDAEAMTQADADAVEALYELKRELDARGMTCWWRAGTASSAPRWSARAW